MSLLEQAPASAIAGRGSFLFNSGLMLWRSLGRLAGAWKGRKLVMAMRDFDDAQLADIGLKRSDVDTALQLPLTDNPSLYLVRARQNPLCGARHF
jgi:uncharacterized protein YjiS (DUF1127 family)